MSDESKKREEEVSVFDEAWGEQKFSITLGDRALEQLENLRLLLGCKNVAETIRHAVGLTNALAQQVADGGTVRLESATMDVWVIDPLLRPRPPEKK